MNGPAPSSAHHVVSAEHRVLCGFCRTNPPVGDCMVRCIGSSAVLAAEMTRGKGEGMNLGRVEDAAQQSSSLHTGTKGHEHVDQAVNTHTTMVLILKQTLRTMQHNQSHPAQPHKK